MRTLFQPRLLHIVTAIGLMVTCGCQGGFKTAMSSVRFPRILARGHERSAPAQRSKVPGPQITERNYAQVQLAMGDSLAKDGNFEAAQAAYEAALRNDDTLARAYHRLALMTEKTGKGGDAGELFERAMELDPKNAEIACDYGYYCYLRQDWQGAQKHFERALQLDPNLKRAHNNMGLVYARNNRPNEALRQFTMAGLNPADARANLGFVYLSQKRFPDAKAELELAAKANPGSPKAQGILARFEKIETNTQPQSTESVAASEPAPQATIRGQFDVGSLPAAEPSDRAAAEARPTQAQETPRIARVEARPAISEAPPRVTMASATPSAPPAAPQSDKRDLPTQQLAPVLSDYQF